MKDEHLFFRLDAEHCQKAYLAHLQRINDWPAGFVRLGTQLEDMTGGATPLGAEYPGTGVRFLRVQNIMPGYIDDTDMAFITAADDAMLARSRLKADDILLTITGVSYGKSTVVTPEYAGGNINQHSVRMHLRADSFRPFFVATFLNAAPGKLQSDQNIASQNFALPIVSDDFQRAVEETVRKSHECFSAAKAAMADAEGTVAAAVGLRDWQPPQPLTYARHASEVFEIGRLDAEHFQPKYDAAIEEAKSRGAKIVNLGLLVEPFIAGVDRRDFVEHGAPYIRVADIRGGRIEKATAARVPITVAETRKDIALRAGDVVFTRKGSFGNAAMVRAGQEDSVISTEIIRLRIREEWRSKLLPEYLVAYCNSWLGKWQAEKWAHGAAFYSVSQDDLSKFAVPIAPFDTQQRIKEAFNQSEAAHHRARDLLTAAQRAVEIAIEKDESAGLKGVETHS